MLGLRSSVSQVSPTCQRLLEATSFHGIWSRSFRVGNTEIPNNNRLATSLTHIHGVGHQKARRILADLNMVNKPTSDLTAYEVNSLREEVHKYLVGEDLKQCVKNDIAKLVEIQCYRGIRHTQRLPCRGQRTKTNCHTLLKGRAIVVPGKKKPTR